MKKFKEAIVYLAIVLAVSVGLLIFVEGLSSAILSIQSLLTPHESVKERRHTQYDALLGWSHIPGISVNDMYGPGVWLTVNSQGFRNTEEITKEIPKGKVRVLCVGDSYTMGYGVNNDQTWCHQLSVIDPNIQAVNMGQGGYGIDQAYLWYNRDGRPLDHDALIFAFINEDFWRMSNSKFAGYPKPILRPESKGFTVENVPVPRWPFFSPRLTNYFAVGRKSAFVELWNSWFPKRSAPWSKPYFRILMRLIYQLHDINRLKHSELYIVALPVQGDYVNNDFSGLRDFLRDNLKRSNIPFIDVVQKFRDELSPNQNDQMYGNHYSVEGNRYVAEVIYGEMLKDKKMRPKLHPSVNFKPRVMASKSNK